MSRRPSIKPVNHVAALALALGMTACEGRSPDEVAYDYIHILRFRDGKAIEHWSVRDDMTLMRQLGVMPERPVPAPAAT